VCGVWCVVCGVWCVVCGVWCVVCGVWCVVCGVWCVVCGVWCVLCCVFFSPISLLLFCRSFLKTSLISLDSQKYVSCGKRGTLAK
jgi:hypothetical protein